MQEQTTQTSAARRPHPDPSAAPQDPPVRRRKVFYIPGYDPMPPRRYRELYRSEGAAQAEISGYQLSLVPRPKTATETDSAGGFGWQVHAQIEGHEVDTDVDVLVWSDIVQDSMDPSIAETYWQMVRTAWIYISTGTLRRLMWLRKGPVIAALYPVGMLLLQAVLAFLLALVIARLGQGGVTRLGLSSPLGTGLAALVFWAAGLVAAAALLRWFRRQDGRLFAYYLMHDYAHSAALRGAYAPELEQRIAQFAGEIAVALSDPNYDEVLVVGHSSGAHVGVSVLADVQRSGLAARHAVLGFLSLGQVMPMVSFLPDAHRLRRDLRDLSGRGDICWVDVTAPGDGCAFALCDPVAVTGVSPPQKRWPLVVSAAFTQTLSPARWAALRWRFFRLHFQYLCAFDQPGDYDYFQITAGPRTLESRYRNRNPSRSRIDVTASKYTSVGG
ncbi:hypothetical protein [Phaeobacter inhibens]|uniref:hypothetical protein n=1 Tax=Phaeobacter inhibens TaxID=221822 RepID=UPI0021A336AE|nr:hypothetical protein [Phaeobacter inhibens]UWR62049.1 hypothetical protein K4F88_06835 [Phaeobacter inhibens]